MANNLPFPRGAQRKEQYRFDLGAEVERFQLSHPARIDDVFFVDAPARRIVRPEINLTFPKMTANDSLVRSLTNYAAQAQRAGEVQVCHYLAGDGHSVIYYGLPDAGRGKPLLLSGQGREEEKAYHFDAAVARALRIDLPPTEAAVYKDVYASLSHYGRSGSKSHLIDHVADMQAVELVLGERNSASFSGPALDAVKYAARTADFSVFNPWQLDQAAARFTEKNMLTRDEAARLNKAYGSFKGTLWPVVSGANFDVLHTLSDRVLAQSDPLTFRWGMRALNTFLDGRVCLDTNTQVVPQGREWDALRARVNERWDKPAPAVVTSHPTRIG